MRRQWQTLVLAFLISVGAAACTAAGDKDDGGSPDATSTPDAGAGGGGGIDAGTTDGGGTTDAGTIDGGATSDGGTSDGGGADGGGPLPVTLRQCANQTFACGDTIDNDNDGLTDADDPECTSPCDNDEDSYATNLPGPGSSPCSQDCYWDENSNGGNDFCVWDHRCDPYETAPDYYPSPEDGANCAFDPSFTTGGKTCSDLSTSQVVECLDFCLPLTPNGCDCFGCCELPAGNGSYVFLGSSGATGTTACSDGDVSDPTLCHPCTPVPSCFNACETCEVCLGKTEPAAGCPTATDTQCPASVQACGLPGQARCPANTYCVSGCCRDAIQ